MRPHGDTSPGAPCWSRDRPGRPARSAPPWSRIEGHRRSCIAGALHHDKGRGRPATPAADGARWSRVAALRMPRPGRPLRAGEQERITGGAPSEGRWPAQSEPGARLRPAPGRRARMRPARPTRDRTRAGRTAHPRRTFQARPLSSPAPVTFRPGRAGALLVALVENAPGPGRTRQKKAGAALNGAPPALLCPGWRVSACALWALVCLPCVPCWLAWLADECLGE